jgi:hypothetical protein
MSQDAIWLFLVASFLAGVAKALLQAAGLGDDD